MVADLKYFDGNLAASIAYRLICVASTPPRSKSSRVGRRSRRAAAEMDRPVQSLNIYIGQASGRKWTKLQACLAAGPEDHLLPALDGRTQRREIDR